MVLYYEPYATVFPGRHHHHGPPPHNSFTLGHYGGGGSANGGGGGGPYGNPQHPLPHHQYVSEIQCPASFTDQSCPSTPTPTWIGNGSPSVFPIGAPMPASSCARSQGGFDEWPTPPPSQPTPSPCAHVSGPPPPPSPSYASSGYKLVSATPSAEFASQADAGHHSPDSGLTVSSDGVSSSDSPQQHATPSLHSSGPPPPLGRPPLIRSPYEWMRKPSYQTQLNPDSMGLLDQGIIGKTRTKDKYRVVYSDLQRLELEKEFHYSRYITIRRKAELAQMLGLSERQVKIWFQNRRAKERKQVKKREELTHKDPKDGLSLHPHQHLHPHPHSQHQPSDGLNSKVISLD